MAETASNKEDLSIKAGAANFVNVQTRHPEYESNREKWALIRAVMNSDCKSYLRNVAASEADAEYGVARQKDYEDGAVFYNFSFRTKEGMQGAVFRKQPDITLPDELEYLLTDSDGNGQPLYQQAQDTLGENIELARGGLLTDMPMEPENGFSLQDQKSGKMNPKVVLYTAESIINWHVERVGAINVLKYIVLAEPFTYTDGVNEFSHIAGQQFRCLDLDSQGNYRQRVWRVDNRGEIQEYLEFNPKANGSMIKEIPFTFFGAQNNDYTVDKSPMLALCTLNVGHYRNSADNEESSFLVGQPTLFIAPGENISPEQFKDANPHGVKFGSRQGHNVGSGGSAILLQAEANNLARQNMMDKEQQAIRIGAQLVTPTGSNQTAEAARIQQGADSSVLSTVANNITMAYCKAIEWAQMFLGINKPFVFKLQTEFFNQPMTAQDRQAWITDVAQGTLPVTEYYAALRRADITKKSDDEIKEELQNQPPRSPLGYEQETNI